MALDYYAKRFCTVAIWTLLSGNEVASYICLFLIRIECLSMTVCKRKQNDLSHGMRSIASRRIDSS